MIARFDSQCEICTEDIEEGVTEIHHDSEFGWIHSDPDECSEEHPDNEDAFATG